MLTFNLALRASGIDPAHVRLLRHETRRHGRTPYALWRDDRDAFDDYQRLQKSTRRAYFASPIWAAFVVAPDGKTLFAGLAAIQLLGSPPADWVDPISGREGDALGGYELYSLRRLDALAAYVGRLAVEWGEGARQWAQRADKQDKAIIELRETFIEPPFPGFAAFATQLSMLETLPASWRGALAAARGVYLLTCPRTREQYVGAAIGDGGFLARWTSYAINGHGGNIRLRSRAPSDYRASVLEIAGSADDAEAVLAMEARWKHKLQSRDMGLNAN